MKSTLTVVLALLCGCARFSTQQEDISYDETTATQTSSFPAKPTRKITTRATAWTFFDARSSLAKFKATQSDKVQSATVGSLENSTSGTNSVAVLQQIAAILNALPK